MILLIFKEDIFCDSGHESPEKSAWGLAECYCEALGLIPRPLGRKLSLVLPSFSQNRPKYPVCLQRGFFYYMTNLLVWRPLLLCLATVAYLQSSPRSLLQLRQPVRSSVNKVSPDLSWWITEDSEAVACEVPFLYFFT